MLPVGEDVGEGGEGDGGEGDGGEGGEGGDGDGDGVLPPPSLSIISLRTCWAIGWLGPVP